MADLVDTILTQATAEDAPARMTNDVDRGVMDGAQDTLGGNRRCLAQIDVRRGDDDVEFVQDLVGQSERTIDQDVDLDSMQEAEVNAGSKIRCV